MALILIIEDEGLLRWALRRQLEQQGHVVHEAATLAEAEEHLRQHRPDVVVLDINLPDGNGLDFFQAQHEVLLESMVLVMTAVGQVEDAVRAMKLGATDFLSKPMDQQEFLAVLARALESQRDRIDVERTRREAERAGRAKVVAESEAMKKVLDLAATVAASPATTVLIQGATGTGKEVVARFIHERSTRADGPRFVINCASLPSELVESELFGHERGAFTDAKTLRRGAFELSQGGTLIFDEIGELSLPLQAKLLRCLEERTIRRVGGAREIAIDVRILALTNRDLEEAVKKGEFRSDLFFRLHVFPITIPPLAERRDDVLPLAHHFLRHFGASFSKSFEGLADDLRDRLLRYDWPGNVRELKNVIERIAILEPGGVVAGKGWGLSELAAAAAEPSRLTLGEAILPLDEVEFLMVSRAMRAMGGNQSAAARLLGVSRDQLRYRLTRYKGEGRWAASDCEAADEAI